MSGLLGLIRDRSLENSEIELLRDAINLAGNFTVNELETTGAFFTVSSLGVTPLKGNRLFENDRWILLFAGDLIDYKEVPYDEIIRSMDENKYEYFDCLEGMFAIAAFNKKDRKVALVTDRRSQYPLYLYVSKDVICFTTSLSVLCRLKRFDFDKRWLWEYLLFNFPVSEVTFVQDVKRIRGGKVVLVDLDSLSAKETNYTRPFEPGNQLLDGKEALSHAFDVFKQRVPLYFRGSNEIACALTSGWDGRTILALAPRRDQITAYTYGIPGCEDLEKARDVAQRTGTKHIPIPFDSELVKELPSYMLETVYLSSGMQGILRGTLLFAYDRLTQKGRRFPITMSGLFVDCLFRGHAASPPLISYDMANLFEGRSNSIRRDVWITFMGSEYAEFEEYICSQLEGLKAQFGEFSSASHHLSYLVYIIAPRYFGGEISIGNYFTTIRVPAWDKQIVEVAYNIKPSTLTFSQFTEHVRGSYEEMVLESYIIGNMAPKFAKIAVGSTRPDFVLKGEYAHLLYKSYNYIKRRLFSSSQTYSFLEDWDHWINVIHKEFVFDLIFSDKSEIRGCVSDGFLEQMRDRPDTHYIGKLVTAEIILRLIKKKWNRFW
jgi:asparagine synthetase B (glutamine-hydrolysing)